MAQQVMSEIFKLDPDFFDSAFLFYSLLYLFSVINVCATYYRRLSVTKRKTFYLERSGKVLLKKSI